MVTAIAALTERLSLHYDAPSYRRVIAGKDVILHCHHYNSRLQRTIEGADLIDGKKLLVTAAEAVFGEHLDLAVRADDTPEVRWALAELLYSHLGFGKLDFSRAAEGVVTASSSHFVEGWLAGLGRPERMVCSFVEGYIQGAFHAATGEAVDAREVECIAQGAAACRFEVSHERQEPIARNPKKAPEFRPHAGGDYVRSPNIDEQKILDALVAMPIHGGADGLIPAFGVYLASMPADFYNRVCIGFVEEMRRVGRATTAERLLIADAENCGMNTFRGIMSSAEWDGLVAPMLKEPDDSLFAVIAISNALGWGNWHVTALEPAQTLGLESLNGYEAIGVREYLGQAAAPQCYMLTGVAAGIMELIYGEGALAERFGTYHTVEQNCIGCGGQVCQFHVERVE